MEPPTLARTTRRLWQVSSRCSTTLRHLCRQIYRLIPSSWCQDGRTWARPSDDAKDMDPDQGNQRRLARQPRKPRSAIPPRDQCVGDQADRELDSKEDDRRHGEQEGNRDQPSGWLGIYSWRIVPERIAVRRRGHRRAPAAAAPPTNPDPPFRPPRL